MLVTAIENKNNELAYKNNTVIPLKISTFFKSTILRFKEPRAMYVGEGNKQGSRKENRKTKEVTKRNHLFLL